MKNVAGWPAGDVVVPQVRAVVEGVERDVVSASLKRTMGDTLSGGDGVIAATGEVTVRTSEETVEQRQITPWSNAAPRRGMRTQIFAGPRGVNLPQLLEGVTDGLSGGTGEDTTLELVDRAAALDKEITWDPLLATMPPVDDGLAFRHVGLTPTYVTSRLLRECGFYATPPFRFGAVVSVPMNGSMWPESGKVAGCVKIGDANSIPDFEPAPWGQAVKNVTSTFHSGSFNPLDADPFELSFLVGKAGTSGAAFIAAQWGAGNGFIRMRVTPGRVVYVEVSYTGDDIAQLASLSIPSSVEQTLVTARFYKPSGRVDMFSGSGQKDNQPFRWPDRMSGNMTRMQLRVDPKATQIAGVQAGFMDHGPIAFNPTADLTPSAFPHSLGAMPAIVRENVADLLKEQAAAELGAFWIDSSGKLIWRNRFALVAGSPVRTITALDDILSLSWSEPSRTTTKSILAQGRRPITSVSSIASITVHQGPRTVIDPGMKYAEVFSPASDEDWIMPPNNVNWLIRAAPDIGGYHLGRRSWIGAVATRQKNGTTEEEWIQNPDIPLQKIDPRAFALEWRAPRPSGWQNIELRSRATDEGIFVQWRDMDLPILRVYGRVKWVNQHVSKSGERNGLQEHTHDVGWWVQHPTGLDSVATAVAERILNAQPILSGVPIVPDTRLELGDIITLQDPSITGLDFRCLIEGIDWDAAIGEQSMTLQLRILTVNGVRATYAELERVWADANWQNLESGWSGSNYTSLERDPLRRST